MSEYAFDILTRDLAKAASRRQALRLLSTAAAGGLLAALGVGCGSQGARPPEAPAADECKVASACGSRQFCNDQKTCLCVKSTEGTMRCGQLPNTCHLPLCKSSADCTYLGAGYFCDTPHSGCCTDPPAHLSRCIAPCGSPPCPAAHLCAGRCCAQNEHCVGGRCVPTETTLAVATATATRDLLFFVRQPDGSTNYYQGVRQPAGPIVGYLTVADGADRATAAVIYNDDYYPIQWVLNGMTIQLRRQPGETFDPAQAFHIVMEGNSQRGQTVDIRPADLSAVVGRLEQATGETFQGARGFLTTTASSYAQILTLARQAGDDQPRLIAAAIGFSTAAAALALADAVSGGSASLAPAFLGPGKTIVKGVAKTILKGAIRDALKPSTPQDPNVPRVDVLLCRGRTMVPKLCHHAFFLGRSPFPCVDLCLTSLDCFTDICMPKTLAWDDVNPYRQGF
jgi:hypothetical protein